jgi:hypothetical protein
MTPKEKAVELSIKMCSSLDVFKPNLASIRRSLIAVDEILNLDSGNSSDKDYWKEVKQELEKL